WCWAVTEAWGSGARASSSASSRRSGTSFSAPQSLGGSPSRRHERCRCSSSEDEVMGKELKILEEALEKAGERIALERKTKKRATKEAAAPEEDLPMQRHEHAVIHKPATEASDVVPGGFPMKP